MFRLVFYPHVFRGERTVEERPSGITVAEAVKGLREKTAYGAFRIQLGGRILPEDSQETIGADEILTVRAVPAGANTGTGADGALNTGKIVGGLAVAAGVALMFIPGMQLAGGILIGTGAASFGASALGNAVINGMAPASDFGSDEKRPKPSVYGARNTSNPYGPVPVLLGKSIVTPPYAAPYWTERISDTEQYINLLFADSIGRVHIASDGDCKVGSTTVLDFSPGSTLSTVYGTGSEVGKTVIEKTEQTEISNTQEIIRITEADIDAISWEIVFPRGCYRTADGKRKANWIDTRVAYRKAGTSDAWTVVTSWGRNLLAETLTVQNQGTGTTGTLVGRPAYTGAYEVKFTKASPDGDGTNVVDQVYLSVLRSIRNKEPISAKARALTTRTSLRLKASSKANGIVDQFNFVGQSMVPTYSGSGTGASQWTTEAATSNPAALYLWMLRGPANPRPIPDALIDWPEFEGWYAWCASNGYGCNAVWDGKASLAEVLQKIASTGRASPVMRDSKYSVVRDIPRTVPVQHFTPRNSWGFVGQKRFYEPVHCLRVRFINAAVGYKQDERLVYADGYNADGSGGKTAATKFQALELWGVTDKDQAYKLARYQMAVAQLRPEVYSLTVDVEHIACQRGDLVRVSHDVPMYGLAAGRIKALVTGAGNTVGVVLDETVAMEAGKSYGLRTRKADGTTRYDALNTTPGSSQSLVYEAPMATAVGPQVGDLVMFGEAGQETAEMLVQGIQMRDDLSATLSLVNYHAGVYTADTEEIPSWSSGVTVPAPAVILPSNVDLETRSAIEAIASAVSENQQERHYLIPNATAITRRSTDGVYNPGALILDAQVLGWYGTLGSYAGRIQIDEWDGSAWATTYTSTSDETGKEYTPSATCQGIRARLYKAGGTATQLDSKEITVSIVWPVTSEGLPASPVTYTPGTLEVTHSISGRGFSASWGKVPSTLDLLRYEVQISTDGSNWHGFDPVTMAGWDKDTLDAWTPSGGSYLSTTIPRLVFPLPLTKNANGTRSDRTWHLRFRQVSTTQANGAYTTFTVKATAMGAGDVASNAITQGQIDLANWLNSQPIQQGLLAHWSFDDVPDYPTAGATYSQGEWATADGWYSLPTPGQISLANGVLSIGGNNFIARGTIPGITGKTLLIKIRQTSGAIASLLMDFNTTTFNLGELSRDWKVFNVNPPNDNIGAVYRSNYTYEVGTLEIDWIYIGNGSYANPLKDQSGNNRSLTLQGGPLAVQGVNGKALTFGQGKWAELPFTFPSEYTISIWFTVTGTSEQHIICSNQDWGPGKFRLYHVNNSIQFEVPYSGLGISGTYNDGKWHHCVFVAKTTGSELYLDGVLKISGPAFTQINASTLAIGRLYVSSGDIRYFNGQVDEVRIYNRALSEAEIRYLYTNPGGPVPAVFGAERIMAGSITANEIASKAITTGQLAVDQISNMAPSSSAIDKSKNYWDLTTGGFRVGTADKYILFNPADTTNPVTVVGNTSFVGSTLPWSQVSDKPDFGDMALKDTVGNSDVTSIDGGKITTGFISADRIQSGSIDGKITQIDGGKITTGQIKSTGHDLVPSSTGTRTRLELDNAKFFLETYISTVLKLQVELSSNGLIAKHSGSTVFSVDATTGDVTFGDYAGGKGMKWLAATAAFAMIGCSLSTASGNFGDLNVNQIWKGFTSTSNFLGHGVLTSEVLTLLTSLTGKSSHDGTAYCSIGTAGPSLKMRKLSWGSFGLNYDGTIYSSGQYIVPPGYYDNFYIREINDNSNFVGSPTMKSGLTNVASGTGTTGQLWSALETLGWNDLSVHHFQRRELASNYTMPGTIRKKIVSSVARYYINVPGDTPIELVSGGSATFGYEAWVM